MIGICESSKVRGQTKFEEGLRGTYGKEYNSVVRFWTVWKRYRCGFAWEEEERATLKWNPLFRRKKGQLGWENDDLIQGVRLSRRSWKVSLADVWSFLSLGGPLHSNVPCSRSRSANKNKVSSSSSDLGLRPTAMHIVYTCNRSHLSCLFLVTWSKGRKGRIGRDLLTLR